MRRFIGDVHGKFKPYREIIRDCEASVQVGDMGVGFRRKSGSREGEEYSNPPHYAMVQGNHRFIRGNHDNPTSCRTHSQWIPDGTVEGDVMYVGGALSVDREWRAEGYDWWPDEELSIPELYQVAARFAEARPRVMVTHDCPESLVDALTALSGRSKRDWPSRTRQALQVMLEAHRPELWVFGHWHHSFDHVIEGTRFVCLAELEHKDLEA